MRSASVMIARRSCAAAVISSGQPFGKLLQQFVLRDLGVGVGNGVCGVGEFGEDRGQVVGQPVHGRIVEYDGGAERFAEAGAEVACRVTLISESMPSWKNPADGSSTSAPPAPSRPTPGADTVEQELMTPFGCALAQRLSELCFRRRHRRC